MSTAFYLDASALVKRYRVEFGTDAVDAVFAESAEGNEPLTSLFSVLEVTAALRRLVAGGAIPATTYDRTLLRFRSDVTNALRLWPLEERVIAESLTVISQHGLRAGDAVHLATARLLAPLVSPAELCVVTSDREFLTAAAASRLTALDPTQPGSLSLVRALSGSS